MLDKVANRAFFFFEKAQRVERASTSMRVKLRLWFLRDAGTEIFSENRAFQIA